MFTVGELRTWLEEPDANADVLTKLEAAAVKAVELWTGRSFSASAERVDYLPGNGTNTLFLKYGPVSAVTEVVESAYVGATAVTVTGATESGWVFQDGKLLRKGGYAWWADSSYRVTYTAGYAAGAEPADVRQAVLDLVGAGFRARGSEELQSESIGDYSYSKKSVAVGETSDTSILARLPRRLRV